MGELLALEWHDIDYAGDVIRVRRSYNVHGGVGSPKSGKVRSVPMVPDVAQRLAALANRRDFTEPEDLVSPGGTGRWQDASSLRIRYQQALERAGLRRLRFHDLRHTFGTLAVRRAEVPAVQAWMGHADIQTTMRYVHHRDRGGEAALLAEAFRSEVLDAQHLAVALPTTTSAAAEPGDISGLLGDFGRFARNAPSDPADPETGARKPQ